MFVTALSFSSFTLFLSAYLILSLPFLWAPHRAVPGFTLSPLPPPVPLIYSCLSVCQRPTRESSELRSFRSISTKFNKEALNLPNPTRITSIVDIPRVSFLL